MHLVDEDQRAFPTPFQIIRARAVQAVLTSHMLQFENIDSFAEVDVDGFSDVDVLSLVMEMRDSHWQVVGLNHSKAIGRRLLVRPEADRAETPDA